MIKSWKHKGLRIFFETGKVTGINPIYRRRLKIILQLLNAVGKPEDMNVPGMKFHKLTGNLSGFYAVFVSGNWRILFRFNHGNIEDVDYADYH